MNRRTMCKEAVRKVFKRWLQPKAVEVHIKDKKTGEASMFTIDLEQKYDGTIWHFNELDIKVRILKTDLKDFAESK